MAENRIDQTTAATQANTTPVLPDWTTKVALVVTGLATTAVAVLPPHTIAYTACVWILSIAGFLGVATPGFRR